MTDTLLFALQLAAVLGCGLMAGLFFAFSAFVMDGLSRIAPERGIAAMQAINAAVMNPLFFLAFFGTPAACLAVAIAALAGWGEPGSAFFLAGSAVYIAGGFIVTMAANVPLNNELEAVTPGRPAADALWSRYLRVWTAWNHVRTVACLAAAALLTLGMVLRAHGSGTAG